MPFLKSRKDGKNGVVDSREAVTPEGKRVVIVGVRMMCQSVKTVQHLEKGVTSVTSKTINFFANVCFGTVLKPSQRGNRVHYLEDEFSDEVFGVEEISAVTLDDSQLVTLKLESGNYLRFQPDTGAQCNVVPLHLYKKATRDFNLLNVTPVSTAIISYGGTSIPILGKVWFESLAWRFQMFS